MPIDALQNTVLETQYPSLHSAISVYYLIVDSFDKVLIHGDILLIHWQHDIKSWFWKSYQISLTGLGYLFICVFLTPLQHLLQVMVSSLLRQSNFPCWWGEAGGRGRYRLYTEQPAIT